VRRYDLSTGKRALELREAFDRAFADPPPAPGAGSEAMLAVRVGGQPYAIRLAEIGGLATDRPIVPVPSAIPELRGVAGIKGALVPVYSLAACLGCEQAEPRWLVLCRGEEPLAFALGELEGTLQVASADLVAPEAGAGASRHVSQVLRSTAGFRGVLDLRSLATWITERVGAAAPEEERRK
jgi:purine-binding chemotaxis protein CheW